jgi:hypothetical protein
MASKFWDSLAKFAPTLATAIGTPFGVGPIAGWAVSALEQALGLPQNSTEEEQAAALATATPEQIIALKKADQEFQVKLKQMDVDLEKISVDDRRSARDMQIANKDWIPGALAFLAIGAFTILCSFVLSGLVDLKGESGLMVGTIIGLAGSFAKDVYSFYFGSTRSSQAKDLTISNLSK